MGESTRRTCTGRRHRPTWLGFTVPCGHRPQPRRQAAAEVDNRAAARALRADPRLDGLELLPSFGGHPDGAWLEPEGPSGGWWPAIAASSWRRRWSASVNRRHPRRDRHRGHGQPGVAATLTMARPPGPGPGLPRSSAPSRRVAWWRFSPTPIPTAGSAEAKPPGRTPPTAGDSRAGPSTVQAYRQQEKWSRWRRAADAGPILHASSSDPRLTNTVCGRQRHGGPAHVGNAPAL
jgi:hypothetical protein